LLLLLLLLASSWFARFDSDVILKFSER